MKIKNTKHPFDRQARWIYMPNEIREQAAPMFRYEFEVHSECISANLYICGLGYYEAYINGRRVGSHVLDPAQTDYDLRRLYVEYDVSDSLKKANNVIGVMLGDGWFNQDQVWNDGKGFSYGSPQLIAQLEIHLTDGSIQKVYSNENWKCSTGPITRSNVYAGENYDARLEQDGWHSPGFEEKNWGLVKVLPPFDGHLEKQKLPPVKVVQEIIPVSLLELKPGIWVLDTGQNLSGWLRIMVQGEAGTKIQMRFAEAIFPNGSINTGSTGVFATGTEQVDTYICKGKGIESWCPRFTYHGFRYVEILGWPDIPSLENFIVEFVHTDLSQAGSFECSDERLNKLHQMVLWTIKSNLHGIPEDCPARERCGWLGDANISCEYSIYNFHSMVFWEKYLDDIETARKINGGLPRNIAPGKRTSGMCPDWMAAYIQIPWHLYVYYGNLEALKRHWDGMCLLLDYFHEQAEDWILSGGYGDWCDPLYSTAPTYTPESLTTTIWFYECSRILACMADLLGFKNKAEDYKQWQKKIKLAFQLNFYRPAQKSFGSQTSDAMALYFGLAPKEDEAAVVNSLVKNAKITHKMHISTGIMGLRYLFEVLSFYGHGDTAVALMHQNSYPGFGDIIQQGATTLWECWGDVDADKTDGARSQNHPMLGGFDNWFYNSLAGIKPDYRKPGFKHFYIAPLPISNLSRVNAHYDCQYGRIICQWEFDKNNFSCDITIPPETSATFLCPYTDERVELMPGYHRTTYESEKIYDAMSKRQKLV